MDMDIYAGVDVLIVSNVERANATHSHGRFMVLLFFGTLNSRLCFFFLNEADVVSAKNFGLSFLERKRCVIIDSFD
jgi:hypothetical protein